MISRWGCTLAYWVRRDLEDARFRKRDQELFGTPKKRKKEVKKNG